MLQRLMQVLTVTAVCIFPMAISAKVVSLVGGGTFIRNQSQNPSQQALLNSCIALDIQGINTRKINKPQSVSGNVLLSTTAVNLTSSQFISNFDVNQIVLLKFDNKTGDYELVLSGKKNTSQAIFLDRPTNTTPVTGTFDQTGDSIVGRLKRKNGIVTRSDWSTGYENCVGIGQPSLDLNDGTPVAQGPNTAAAFESCALNISLGLFTPMPTASSFAPGEPNFKKLPTDRSLGGDITVLKKKKNNNMHKNETLFKGLEIESGNCGC